MDTAWVPQLVSSIKNRFADGKDSLSWDAHDQEGFKTKENILQRIEEVGKDDDVQSGIDILTIIQKHET